jgi:RimJ/RimL family protein N-acetyltransferase
MGGMNAVTDKHSGKLIGYCGLLVQTVDNQTELEIGYSMLPEFRKQGWATEAAVACRDFAFKHKFSESLISIISVTNQPSANVALHVGIRLEKQTVYAENKVNIFRIHQKEWEQK